MLRKVMIVAAERIGVSVIDPIYWVLSTLPEASAPNPLSRRAH